MFIFRHFRGQFCDAPPWRFDICVYIELHRCGFGCGTSHSHCISHNKVHHHNFQQLQHSLSRSNGVSLLQQGRCESYSVARWLFYCRAIAAVAMGGIVVIYFQYGSFESVLLICTAIYLICGTTSTLTLTLAATLSLTDIHPLGRAMTETSCEIVTNMSLSGIFVSPNLIKKYKYFLLFFKKDVIDEDMVANQRKNRVSSAIIGCCQLLSRPAQSISPILVVWLLEPYNFTTSSTDGRSQVSIYFVCFSFLFFLSLLLLFAKIQC